MKSNIKLSEVMLKIGSFPIVFKDELMQDTIIKMNHFGLGIACLVDNNNKLVGVLTDGDLRRMILNVQKPMAAIFVDDVEIYATKSFTKIDLDTPLNEAVLIMEELKIWDLPIINKKGILKGLLHLHPAIKLLLGI